METPELSPFSNPGHGASVAELERTVAGLRTLLVVTLVILLIGTAGVNVLLFRQVGNARRSAEELEKRVVPAANQFETVLKPRVSMFLNELVGVARTDPEFARILGKYPIAATPNPQPPPGPATPAVPKN
jgi:hypothetical protein